MKQYRFFLEPWGWRDHLTGGRASNKHICPNCGKKTFVRYVDGETGSYLGDMVGKCDREDKCGYHYSPAMYFKDHPEAVRKDLSSPTAVKRPSLPLPATSEISTIDWKYVESSRLQTSNFKDYLLDRFRDCHPQVLQVCEDYFLGGDGEGGTIYWQIDEQDRVRSGKIMHYLYNGHRDKEKDGDKTNWTHWKMKQDGRLPAEWTLTQCLFGAHLLPRHPDKTVALVESEKSAVIASIVLPQYLWVSCGGKMNLEAGQKHLALQGRKVVMFPDTDPDGETFDFWSKKAAEWREKGFDVQVSDILEKTATEAQKAAKIDIADLLEIDLRKTYVPSPIEFIGEESEQEQALAAMIEANPSVKLLIDKFNLKAA